jgi:hypothetical protein
MIIDNPSLQSTLNRSSKDKFYLVLDLPYALKKRAEKDPSISIDPLQISVHGTLVPEIAVPEVDMRFLGQNLHLSTYARPNYPPITINFVVDSQYKNYYVLWQWLDVMNMAINDFYGGTGTVDAAIVGDQFEYQTTIKLVALDEYNEPVIEFIYSKAFLSTLGALSYSYREGNTLVESSATFHFSQLDVKKKNALI